MFNGSELTYDISSNKFVQVEGGALSSITTQKIFNDGNNIVKNESGGVALSGEVLDSVSKFLCDYVFHIQHIRENIKTIAQKHAMRGTGALLVHIVNDYLIKELPYVRDRIYDEDDGNLRFGWETDSKSRNYGNVKVLEYEDDNEYFNIEPDGDVRFTERTNERYWEKLSNLSYDDSLGVLTKRQIRDFYRNTLGMGRLRTDKGEDFDDVQDFLVGLFKIGANPIKLENGELKNPIDDIFGKSEEDYGYTKEERLEVQNNAVLRQNQEEQFTEYSGNPNLIGGGIYDYVNSKLFYYKNKDFSSHVLHPFMYNLKLWNKMNNIIINGYKDYVNSDLIDYMSSKAKFDELFGEYGESRNFWKYNVMDLSGYTTRYEAAIKNQHIDDERHTISSLTGYDGLFYPSAASEFLAIAKDANQDMVLTASFFNHSVKEFKKGTQDFLAALYSIYWQDSNFSDFYLKWYSHLDYNRAEYQRIALQLWYWRGRIVEMMTNNYAVDRYVLDIQGNSLILVQPFKNGDETSNRYLIDLALAQYFVENPIDGNGNWIDGLGNSNKNTKVPYCENKLRKPSELWIKWKSNPIAMPAFDIYCERKTGFSEFDLRYRNEDLLVDMGQVKVVDSTSNDNLYLVVKKWLERYCPTKKEKNCLPVFFDMEQSANVLVLASWYEKNSGIYDDSIGKSIVDVNCAKNPHHIFSYERVTENPSEYALEEYGDNSIVNDMKDSMEWLFSAYCHCPSSGAILIPFYRFVCEDGISDKQSVNVRMFVLNAQWMKTEQYSAS